MPDCLTSILPLPADPFEVAITVSDNGALFFPNANKSDAPVALRAFGAERVVTLTFADPLTAIEAANALLAVAHRRLLEQRDRRAA